MLGYIILILELFYEPINPVIWSDFIIVVIDDDDILFSNQKFHKVVYIDKHIVLCSLIFACHLVVQSLSFFGAAPKPASTFPSVPPPALYP